MNIVEKLMAFRDSQDIAQLGMDTCIDLENLGFENFTIRINDRRILKALAKFAGFEEDKFDLAFIEFDKMDKVGIEGVKESLINNGFNEECVTNFLSIFNEGDLENDIMPSIDDMEKILTTNLEDGVICGLKEIIEIVPV